jgi:polyphosphate kinase 2 (PPK2 family)
MAFTFKEARRLFQISGKKRVRLRDHDPAWKGKGEPEFEDLTKPELKARVAAVLSKNIAELADAQERLYASDVYAVLIVLQAMDAAGKDGTIKHVMSGVNPQGCQVFAFKQPSSEDDDINHFERHLTRNGTLILKFFLHLSKGEQKKRFKERLDRPDKHWKFSFADLKERERWNDYQGAFEQMLEHTSTQWAPWWVIPADHKWVTRALIASIITSSIDALGVKTPEVTGEQLRLIAQAKKTLA